MLRANAFKGMKILLLIHHTGLVAEGLSERRAPALNLGAALALSGGLICLYVRADVEWEDSRVVCGLARKRLK